MFARMLSADVILTLTVNSSGPVRKANRLAASASANGSEATVTPCSSSMIIALCKPSGAQFPGRPASPPAGRLSLRLRQKLGEPSLGAVRVTGRVWIFSSIATLAPRDSYYPPERRCVGAAGEIEKVNQVFQPSARCSASNSQ